jgi:broad specificity phosphatase PhoE
MGVNKKNERSFFFLDSFTRWRYEEAYRKPYQKNRVRNAVMGEIYFVRHGQASFGADDYDQLSPNGIRQARIVARYLAQTGKAFDAVYHGEMQRQKQTAREYINHCGKNQLDVCRPHTAAAFNEYDSFAVWEALIPELTAEQPALCEELKKLPQDQKAFQKIFSQVMNRWTRNEYKAEGIPRWDDFTRRVVLGIQEIAASAGAKKRLLVFTSGGPISVAVKSALGLSDRMTIEMSWQLMNASITRLKYNRQGIMLAGFNDITHLELEGDQSLLTYR